MYPSGSLLLSYTFDGNVTTMILISPLSLEIVLTRKYRSIILPCEGGGDPNPNNRFIYVLLLLFPDVNSINLPLLQDT